MSLAITLAGQVAGTAVAPTTCGGTGQPACPPAAPSGVANPPPKPPDAPTVALPAVARPVLDGAAISQATLATQEASSLLETMTRVVAELDLRIQLQEVDEALKATIQPWQDMIREKLVKIGEEQKKIGECQRNITSATSAEVARQHLAKIRQSTDIIAAYSGTIRVLGEKIETEVKKADVKKREVKREATVAEAPAPATPATPVAPAPAAPATPVAPAPVAAPAVSPEAKAKADLDDLLARQREAIDDFNAAMKEMKDKYGKLSADDIASKIEEAKKAMADIDLFVTNVGRLRPKVALKLENDARKALAGEIEQQSKDYIAATALYLHNNPDTRNMINDEGHLTLQINGGCDLLTTYDGSVSKNNFFHGENWSEQSGEMPGGDLGPLACGGEVIWTPVRPASGLNVGLFAGYRKDQQPDRTLAGTTKPMSAIDEVYVGGAVTIELTSRVIINLLVGAAYQSGVVPAGAEGQRFGTGLGPIVGAEVCAKLVGPLQACVGENVVTSNENVTGGHTIKATAGSGQSDVSNALHWFINGLRIFLGIRF